MGEVPGWLTPGILATQEAEIGGSRLEGSPGKQFCETLYRKTLYQKRAGGVAQGVGPEFKPQYCKKQKRGKEVT
jgi:hypothetical protein